MERLLPRCHFEVQLSSWLAVLLVSWAEIGGQQRKGALDCRGDWGIFEVTGLVGWWVAKN